MSRHKVTAQMQKHAQEGYYDEEDDYAGGNYTNYGGYNDYGDDDYYDPYDKPVQA